MKNIDSVRRSGLINSFFKVFFYILILTAVITTIYWEKRYRPWTIPISFFISLVIALVVDYLSSQLGNTSGKLFTGGAANWSLMEQLAGVLNEARLAKREERFDDAIRILDAVLGQAPEFPEALFLKAQVLVDGFNDIDQAKLCLIKAMKLTSESDEYYRWSETLYREILKK